MSNSQSRQLSNKLLLCWSTSDQPVCQTVSQDSDLFTQLVNKNSDQPVCQTVSQDSYLISYYFAGQQVISQFVKQSVKTVIY